MNEVNILKEVLKNAILEELHVLGFKTSLIPKTLNKTNQVVKPPQRAGFIFSKPLQRLSSRIVTLNSGVEAEVPIFILEVCSCVLKHADVEGLFRKAGSSARQRELKIILDEGDKVDYTQHHVIDIANILKCFLRELPEPLLPYTFHEIFLHCLVLENAVEAVLLLCLLLPRPHLHVLAYVMETIASFSAANKMDLRNLSIILAPSIMPFLARGPVIPNPQRLNAHVRVVEILMANAEKIGVLPDGVTDRLSLTSSLSNLSVSVDQPNFSGHGIIVSMKKKRRRSGSLTRMFNGLKKIVGGKTSPEREGAVQADEQLLIASTPDFSTPCVKPSKKRKAESSSAFSCKKKRDVLQALPQSTTLASTPFKCFSEMKEVSSSTTPRVCLNPNPMSQSPPKVRQGKSFSAQIELAKPGVLHSRKGIYGVSNLMNRKQKQTGSGGNFLERSWSAVSSSSSWGRKKPRRSSHNRMSLVSADTSTEITEESNSSHDADVGVDLSGEQHPSDFVRVPKTEYEQLKSRMSAIESCISQEFSSILPEPTLSLSPSPEALSAAPSARAVQTAYEKTLEGADVSKDSSTDLLAKRLSRELRIRRSGEGKVIRSPSARKIGSLRRRSRDRQSPSARRELRRNKSWHNMQRAVDAEQQLSIGTGPGTGSGSNLRRGRPNTIFSGLPHPHPHPTPTRMNKDCKEALGASTAPNPKSAIQGRVRRLPSFHSTDSSAPLKPVPKKCSSQVTLAKAALLAHAGRNGSSGETWYDAQDVLSKTREALDLVPVTGRESIAKLRNQNAGKVMATAKLFNASRDVKSSESRKSLNPVVGSDGGGGGGCEPERPGSASSGKPTGRTRTTLNFETPVSSRAVLPPRKDSSPRPKQQPSQSEQPTCKPNLERVKKHNSLKYVKKSVSVPVKRHQSAPVQGKENIVSKSSQNGSSFSKSPQSLKMSPLVLEKSSKISVSPLRDCNRISLHAHPLSSSKPVKKSANIQTPSIKQPLTTRSPCVKGFTPQKSRMISGPVPRFNSPFVATPIRKSPRLIKQTVNVSKQVA